MRDPGTHSFRSTPSFRFTAIGTAWTIDLYTAAPGGRSYEQLERSIMARIEQFDRDYSRFRGDSWVTRLSQQAGEYHLPADAAPLLQLYRQLYDLTAGQVTPLIGQALSDAGYDREYSLQSKPKLTVPPDWDDSMTIDLSHPSKLSAGNLNLRRPALLDFGAAGKGYLVDIIAELLEAAGFTDYCVDAGGDIRCGSNPAGQSLAQSIALEHPDDPTSAIGLAQISQGSLCGSAGNRRAWGDYHHIISPTSLQSPRHIKAVWVVSDRALLSDGLTTALFFVHPETLSQHFGFAYAIMYADNSLQYSDDFPAEFYT